jgi:hypothetical protein
MVAMVVLELLSVSVDAEAMAVWLAQAAIPET